jgi:hypothetical protein
MTRKLDRLVAAEGFCVFLAWVWLDSELARLAGYYGNPSWPLFVPCFLFASFMLLGPWLLLLWVTDVWEGRRC